VSDPRRETLSRGRSTRIASGFRAYVARQLTAVCVLLFVGGGAAPLAAQATQTRREVLLATVRDSAGAPLAGAELLITLARTFDTRRATTGADGRARVVIEAGPGDYLVTATNAGYAAARMRVTLPAGSDSAVVELRLRRNSATLPTVQVQSDRPVARDPNLSLGARGGGAEQVISEQVGGVAAADAGDLALAAALNPALTATSTGVGALGLGAEQSRTTLNGLPFDGGAIPRDMRRVVRAGTSIYDPAIGGFSAALTSVEIARGSIISAPFLRGSIDGSPDDLQGRVTPGMAAGRRAVLSGAMSGELVPERWVYSSGVTVSRSDALAATLGSASSPSLALLGVSSMQLTSVLADARARGIPLDARTAHDPSTTRIDALGRLDYLTDRTGGAIALLAGASIRESDGGGLDPTTNGSRATSSDRESGFLQLSTARELASGWHIDWRSGFSVSAGRTTSVSAAPAVDVPLLSTADDALLATVHLGGAGLANTREDRLTWESAFANDRLYQTAHAGRHQLRYIAQWQLDATQVTTDPSSGTYALASSAQLASGAATAYTRQLDATTQRARALNAALGIGDLWRPMRFLSLQAGVRVDVGGPLATLSPDAALVRQLGGTVAQTSDFVRPQLSPRLGFTWTYDREKASAPMGSSTPLGSLVFPGNGQLRGGIGLFRSYWTTNELLSTATWHAGEASRTLQCDAATAPTVTSWLDPADAPATCTDGRGVLANTSGTYLAQGVRTPAAWRANLAWAKTVGWLRMELGGTLSYGVDQRSIRDVNVTLTPRFTLAGEGGRPSYRAAADIDAMSGAPATPLARSLPTVGPVLEVSDAGRNRAQQLTLLLDPKLKGPWMLRVNGAYVESRSWQNGWSNAGLTSPTAFTWAPTDGVPRWRSVIEFGRVGTRLLLSGIARFDAGARYTPRVLGDINGDGRSGNDVAYIPSFASGSGGMGSPLFTVAAKDGRVSDCLRSQQGHVAAAGSCVAPPSAQVDLALSLLPHEAAMMMRGGGRTTYTLRVANMLGLLDDVVHAQPRGWGASGGVDPYLLSVRGCDPVTQAYRYAVNPTFGQRDQGLTALRAPYRISIDAQLYLGKSFADQQAVRTIGMSRLGGTVHQSPERIAARLRPTFVDPYALLLEQADSLLLQREQVTAITAAQSRLTARTDSIWLAAASDFAALPERFDPKVVGDRLQRTYADVIKALQDGVQPLTGILAKPQLERLPGDVQELLARQRPLFHFR